MIKVHYEATASHYNFPPTFCCHLLTSLSLSTLRALSSPSVLASVPFRSERSRSDAINSRSSSAMRDSSSAMRDSVSPYFSSTCPSLKRRYDKITTRCPRVMITCNVSSMKIEFMNGQLVLEVLNDWKCLSTLSCGIFCACREPELSFDKAT